MRNDLPAPLTPPGCDLRDFPHTPLYRARLFGSSFHAQATDAEWRAGLTLWLKSWDQVPAGSLPQNDIELCRLAELARDLKAWGRLREGAMRGWLLCSDGRLYHPVVAEGVNNAIEAKLKQRLKTAKARIAALEKHLAAAVTDDDKARITDEIRKLQQTLSQGLSQTLSQGPREGEVEGKEKGLNINTPPTPQGGRQRRPAPVLTNALMEAFEVFYAAYPRKRGKKAAMAAWIKLNPDEALQAKILGALAAQRPHLDKREGGRFIKHPATWLNHGCWDDEIPGAKAAAPVNDAGQTWWEAAGFDSMSHAQNERCHILNYAEFRNGRRITEASA